MNLYSKGVCPKCGGQVNDVFVRVNHEEAINRKCVNCSFAWSERPLDWCSDTKEIKIYPIGGNDAEKDTTN